MTKADQGRRRPDEGVRERERERERERVGEKTCREKETKRKSGSKRKELHSSCQSLEHSRRIFSSEIKTAVKTFHSLHHFLGLSWAAGKEREKEKEKKRKRERMC